jgi:predicted nucleotidyltransferase
MPQIVFHTQADARERVEARRMSEMLALSPGERMQQAFRLMQLAAMFKNGPLKEPQQLGVLLKRSKQDSRMDLFAEEITGFFQALNKHNVKYILVGGLAVNFYGYSRTTGDVDIWLQDSPENRNALVNALTEFGIEGAEIFHQQPFVAGYTELLLGNSIYIDLMANLHSLKQSAFSDCYTNAADFKLEDNCIVKVIHINQLIAEKRVTGRLKDADDADHLEAQNR